LCSNKSHGKLYLSSDQSSPEELAEQNARAIAKQQASLARLREQGIHQAVFLPQAPLLQNEDTSEIQKERDFVITPQARADAYRHAKGIESTLPPGDRK
jgi:hypothetical protein